MPDLERRAQLWEAACTVADSGCGYGQRKDISVRRGYHRWIHGKETQKDPYGQNDYGAVGGRGMLPPDLPVSGGGTITLGEGSAKPRSLRSKSTSG